MIKPCPFCGKDPTTTTTDLTYAICCFCETMPSIIVDKTKQHVAIEIWNRRNGDECVSGCKMKRHEADIQKRFGYPTRNTEEFARELLNTPPINDN